MSDRFTCEQTGPADVVIRYGPDIVGLIRDLRLVCGRFRPGGRCCIGPTVPLPLFWMQYANHQDPERNAGSDARATVRESGPERIVISCTGRTASGACVSSMTLSVSAEEDPVRFCYHVDARLEVTSESGWTVTPNMEHGEVEFANLWPDGTFVPGGGDRKLYQGCFVEGPLGILRIPHTHFESADKHNIPLHPRKRFLWLLEDENPCLTLESGSPVLAGVCAYMWDAHFGYRVCSNREPVILPVGSLFEAAYSLRAMSREEGEAIARSAAGGKSPETESVPIYLPGLNRFSTFPVDLQERIADAWPWETEIDANVDAHCVIDDRIGFDDSHSARIESRSSGKASWKATTIGPAYGQQEFPAGSRFRLSAQVRTENLAGTATVVLRLHREGTEDLFDPSTYERFASPLTVRGDTRWTLLDLTTPPISPPPDRVHILLVQEGPGTSWFDNVELEVFQ